MSKDDSNMNERAPSDSLEGLAAFAKEVISAAFEGNSFDGADIQELGVKHGLLKETRFDPSIHSDPMGYAEFGDLWFVYAGALATAAEGTP